MFYTCKQEHRQTQIHNNKFTDTDIDLHTQSPPNTHSEDEDDVSSYFIRAIGTNRPPFYDASMFYTSKQEHRGLR